MLTPLLIQCIWNFRAKNFEKHFFVFSCTCIFGNTPWTCRSPESSRPPCPSCHSSGPGLHTEAFPLGDRQGWTGRRGRRTWIAPFSFQRSGCEEPPEKWNILILHIFKVKWFGFMPMKIKYEIISNWVQFQLKSSMPKAFTFNLCSSTYLYLHF